MTDERGDHSELREQMKLGGQAGEAHVHLGGGVAVVTGPPAQKRGQVSDWIAEFLARSLGYRDDYHFVQDVAEVFAAPGGAARLGRAIAEAREAARIKEQHEWLVNEIAALIRDSEEYAEELLNAAKRRAGAPAQRRGQVSEWLASFLARDLEGQDDDDFIRDIAEVFAAPDGGARLEKAIAEAREAAHRRERRESLVDRIAHLIRDGEEDAEALFNAAKERVANMPERAAVVPRGADGEASF